MTTQVGLSFGLEPQAPPQQQVLYGVAAVYSRTGFESQLPEFLDPVAGALTVPEQTDPIPTSLLASGGGYEYADATGLSATLTGTLSPLALTGSCGDIDIVVGGTLAAATVEVTNGSIVEERTLSLGGGSRVTTTTGWYVDSVNGSDAADGLTLATAKQTIGALTLSDGDTVHLSRGSHWRESIGAVNRVVHVRAVGVGPRPIVSACDVVATWALVGGTTNVYSHSFDPVDDLAIKGQILVVEDGRILAGVADRATCDATPGSFVIQATSAAGPYTIEIHCTDSADPDTHVIELSSRAYAIVGRGSSSVRGVMTRCGVHDDGSVSIYELDSSDAPIVDDCWAINGGKHNILINNVGCSRCTFLGTSPAAAGSASQLVINRNTGTGGDIVVSDSIFLQWPSMVNAAVAPIFGHTNVSGALGNLTMLRCQYAYYAGHVATAAPATGCQSIDLVDCLWEAPRFGSASHQAVLNHAGAPMRITRGRCYTHRSDDDAIRFASIEEDITFTDHLSVAKTHGTGLAYQAAAGARVTVDHSTLARVNGVSSMVWIGDNADLEVDFQHNLVVASANAFILDRAGSLLVASNYNVITATTLVRESALAAARAFSVYLGDQVVYDQASSTAVPAFVAGTDAGRYPAMTPATPSEGVRTLTAIDPYYLAVLALVESRTSSAPTVTITDPGVVADGLAFTLEGTFSDADGADTVSSIVVTWAGGGSATATLYPSGSTTGTWSATVTLTGTSLITLLATATDSTGKTGTDTQDVTPIAAVDGIAMFNALGATYISWGGDGSGTYVHIDAGNVEAGDQVDEFINLITGGGTNATQATDAKQPTLINESGVYSLSFNADNLVLPSGILGSKSAISVVVRFKLASTAGTQDLVGTGTASSAQRVSFVSGVPRFYVGVATYCEGTAALNPGVVYDLQCDFVGSLTGNDRSQMFLDGPQLPVNYVNSQPATTDASTTSRIGRNYADTANSFLGQLYFIAIIPDMTAAKRAIVNAALALL